MDQFADLAKELESAGIDHEMITYGGVQYDFTVFGESVIKRLRIRNPGSNLRNFLLEL